MKPLVPLVLLPLLASAGAQTVHVLKPYVQPTGQVLRIESTSASANAEVITEKDGTKERAPLHMGRIRTLERRSLQDGSISCSVIEDLSESTHPLDVMRESGKASSALKGSTARGFRDLTGHWHFYLPGRTPTNQEALALAELGALENRRWFVDRPVKIGESWPVDPALIRHLLLRDLADTRLEASMTLSAVKEIDGKSTAVLDLKIQSVSVKSNDRTQPAKTSTLNATGTLLVTLDTMLDRKLNINGSLLSTTRTDDSLTTVILPFSVKMTRSTGG